MTKHQKNRVSTALHRLPEREAAEKLKANVLAVADEIFDRYVWGESMQSIADSLPFKIQGWKLRNIVMESEETRELYENANILRSHNLIEAALDYGRTAAALGDAAGLRVAVDTNLKIAAKLNSEYNDKASLELTGKGGGPVKLLALTDDELTRIAAQAASKAAK